MKTIIVSGAGGQDGSYLIDYYLERGYRVIGLERWMPCGPSKNLDKALENQNFILETGDINEYLFIHRVFEKYKPDIFFNMAAISLVPESFRIPKVVFETNTMALLNILEEIRNFSPKTKIYQASTSEQIGTNREVPQNTESRMLPNSPYAISKIASYHLIRSYREAFGLFAVNGLLWNHESERRGPDFVTRKITLAVARISKSMQESVSLGNLNAIRDWGYAKDFVEAMAMMMELNIPDDYPVATGESHTIREFVEEAFKNIGMTITWEGSGVKEVGKDQNGVVRVKVDERFYRPVEVPQLCGDYSKTEKLTGWKPRTKFTDLVKRMVEHDINLL